MEKLILLIDDDQEETEIMNQALEIGKIKGQCLWANGAEHAMRLLKHIEPDYIFIDINMPGIDGLTCLKELNKNKLLVNTPMVIYSNHINNETKDKAKEQGAVCCIQKPGKLEILVMLLKSFLASYAVPQVK